MVRMDMGQKDDSDLARVKFQPFDSLDGAARAVDENETVLMPQKK